MRSMSKAVPAFVLLALAVVAAPVAAQERGGDEEGIPAYSVARLKIYEGSAWVRVPDSGDWEEYLHNTPVTEKTRISIPEGSEAELQFHGGQYVLLTAGTELDIRQLADEKTSFRLRAGEIRFYLPENDFSPVRVSIPDGGHVSMSVPGRYWLTGREGADDTLVVRAGEGEVAVEGGEFRVKAGEEASIGGDVRIGKYTGPADDYDAPPPLSAEEGEAGIPPAAAYELREYGEWVHTDEYGTVWRPRVTSGWSPYYYGRWAWVSPIGWTWVSYEPWGWYPYHYGYWYIDPLFGWVWSPYNSFVSFSFVFGHHHFTHFHRHAHFAPANVRFVRDGRSVRWVPLRPGEARGRVAFTRTDPRLASWERPLTRGTVFVRHKGERGHEWRDWTAARGDRREGVKGRTAKSRPGEIIGVKPGREARPGRVERPPDTRGRAEGDRGPRRDAARELRRDDRPAPPERMERLERDVPAPRRMERGRRSERYGPPPARSESSPRADRGGQKRSAEIAPRGRGGEYGGPRRFESRPVESRRVHPGSKESRSVEPRGRGDDRRHYRGDAGGPARGGGGRSWFDFGGRGGDYGGRGDGGGRGRSR